MPPTRLTMLCLVEHWILVSLFVFAPLFASALGYFFDGVGTPGCPGPGTIATPQPVSGVQ
jgi:hypothetical protein